jgi:hypothetical protein
MTDSTGESSVRARWSRMLLQPISQLVACSASAALLAACTAQLLQPAGPDGVNAGNATAEIPELTQQVRPLLRLKQNEYDNTLRDLLGVTTHPASALPPDTHGASGFLAAERISDLATRVTMEMAERLASDAVQNIDTLAPCTSGDQRACAQDFILQFGRRAFRRPLEGAEAMDLLALYDLARFSLGEDYTGAVRVLISAMLQSPQFLYHWESGIAASRQGESAELGPFELASRLSYLVWQSMPDDALLDRAEKGGLSTPDDLAEELERLLGDPRAKDGIGTFVSELYRLDVVMTRDKDPNAFPSWQPDLQQALVDESVTFASKVILEGDGNLATLLLAPYSYLNEQLAAHYGIAGITGPELRKVDTPGRFGLLSHAGFLSGHAGPADGALSTPIRRGQIVRERVLCQPIQPPMVVPIPPDSAAGTTTRQRLEEHTQNAACATCHKLMDPIGLAFEKFDAVGRARSTDHGLPIDTSGTLVGLGDALDFRGPEDMLQRIAESDRARDCMATNLLRYMLGIDVGVSYGKAVRVLAGDGELSADLNVRDALLALVQSPVFTQRILNEGEPDE